MSIILVLPRWTTIKLEKIFESTLFRHWATDGAGLWFLRKEKYMRWLHIYSSFLPRDILRTSVHRVRTQQRTGVTRQMKQRKKFGFAEVVVNCEAGYRGGVFVQRWGTRNLYKEPMSLWPNTKLHVFQNEIQWGLAVNNYWSRGVGLWTEWRF